MNNTAAAVVQLVERSLPTLVVHVSNSINDTTVFFTIILTMIRFKSIEVFQAMKPWHNKKSVHFLSKIARQAMSKWIECSPDKLTDWV